MAKLRHEAEMEKAQVLASIMEALHNIPSHHRQHTISVTSPLRPQVLASMMEAAHGENTAELVRLWLGGKAWV